MRKTSHLLHVQTPEGSPLPPKSPKLSEITSEEDLNKLTAKQLKVLLTLNRVDYKGCVEKTDLLERAAILWRENQKQEKGIFDSPSKYLLRFTFHIF